MRDIKSELALRTSDLYYKLYARALVIKILLFVSIFSLVFWYVRLNNLLPITLVESDLRSIPILFSAGNFLYSIFTGFVVQTQWTKWDKLIDAHRSEITMLRQLFILAHHFPKEEMFELRYRIYRYLDTYIKASEVKDIKILNTRSKNVDEALVQIDDTMFKLVKKYSHVGPLISGYLTRAMEYREIKLQLSRQRLPLVMRVFIYFATFSIIFGSLFFPFHNTFLNFYFALVVAMLAYGVYLIIEDFDDPFRPGNFMLRVGLYRSLQQEIKAKLLQRGFNFKKAEAQKYSKLTDL